MNTPVQIQTKGNGMDVQKDRRTERWKERKTGQNDGNMEGSMKDRMSRVTLNDPVTFDMGINIILIKKKSFIFLYLLFSYYLATSE